MKFSEWLSLEARGFGSFAYKVPKDKEQQLYDFYMLQYIIGRSSLDIPISQMYKKTGFISKVPKPSFGPEGRFGGMTGEDETDYMIDEVRKTLLPALKNNLLDAVFFSVAAEIRHVTDRVGRTIKQIYDLVKDKLGEESAKIFKEYVKNLELRQVATTAPLMRRPKTAARGLGLSTLTARRGNDRVSSYYAALKSTENHKEFMKLAEFLYGNLSWDSSYGGEAWEQIADSWIKLSEAKRTEEIFIWIDHVYDLQHNTSTVFNKVKSYAKSGGYGWLKDALDHKAAIKEPHELVHKISPQMRKLADPVIKLKFDKSLEQFENEKMIRDFKKATSLPMFNALGESESLVQKIVRVVTNPAMFDLPSYSSGDIIEAAKQVYDLSNYQVSQIRKLYQFQKEIENILNSESLIEIRNITPDYISKAEATKLFYKVPSDFTIKLSKFVPDDLFRDRILPQLKKPNMLEVIKDLKKLGLNLRNAKILAYFLFVSNIVYGEIDKKSVINIAAQQNLERVKKMLDSIHSGTSTLGIDVYNAYATSTNKLKNYMLKVPTQLQDVLDSFSLSVKENIIKAYGASYADYAERSVAVDNIKKLGITSSGDIGDLIVYVVMKHKWKQQRQQQQPTPNQGSAMLKNVTKQDWSTLKSVVESNKPNLPLYVKNIMNNHYPWIREKLNKLAAPAKEHILKNHNKPGSTIKTSQMLGIDLDQAYDLEEYIILQSRASGLAA